MKITITTLSLIAGTALFCSTASADEVRIPVGQQGAEKQNIEKPRNGQTKQQVQDKFGEPQKQNGPVGDPPISSWEYSDYVVYFEHDRVLHAVLKGSAKAVN
ncbi:hypothetical protein QSV34_00940 [Porticoccus sp. W117]|uniref:hypothetical protein n=1 Tax=Porticoccus sp. W117 TaxID=3054777 RepID=UPI002595778A|nr:hypothetical protein [Porticoccus sp. W117]MDM3869910.1 hypothetical protein [Porticoccus sp. W117]